MHEAEKKNGMGLLKTKFKKQVFQFYISTRPNRRHGKNEGECIVLLLGGLRQHFPFTVFTEEESERT